MKKLIFGITVLLESGRPYYLVWSAPEPEDIDTEPEYVKPLAVRFSVRTAQKALREFETEYKANPE